MKWRFFFRKKRGKKGGPEENIYSEVKPKTCYGDKFSAQFTFQSSPSGPAARKPILDLSIHHLNDYSEETSDENFFVTPLTDVSVPPSPFDRFDAKRPETVDEDALTLTGTVAFCPHCHMVVQPITKKRPNIRTNPWMGVTSNLATMSSKRLRLADFNHTPHSSMTDSGIFDQPVHSDVSGSGDRVTEEGAEQFSMPDENQQPYYSTVPHMDTEPRNDPVDIRAVREYQDSDTENEPPKRRRRRKKKRRSHKKSAEIELPTAPFFFKDPLENNLWLNCGETSPTDLKDIATPEDQHLASRPVRYIPPDTLDLPCVNGNPSFSDSREKVAHYLQYLDSPVDQSPWFQSESSTLVDNTPNQDDWNEDAANMESHHWYETKSPSKSNATRSVDQIRESLRDKIEKLCRDKLELEQQFSRVEEFQKKQVKEQDFLAQEIVDYRQELILRSLSSAQQQLDAQLDTLQASYDALVNWKFRKMFDNDDLNCHYQYPHSLNNTRDNVLVEYEDSWRL